LVRRAPDSQLAGVYENAASLGRALLRAAGGGPAQ
jgi:hypothetical protein